MLNRERWSVFLLENFVFSSNVALHHLLYEVIMVVIWEVFPWDEGHWRGYVVTHTQPLVVQNIPKFGTMDRFSLKHFVYQTENKQPKWKLSQISIYMTINSQKLPCLQYIIPHAPFVKICWLTKPSFTCTRILPNIFNSEQQLNIEEFLKLKTWVISVAVMILINQSELIILVIKV